MGNHHARRFGTGGVHGSIIGHRQNLAGTQAIQIIAGKCVRVGAVQGHQHQVERDVGRFHSGRNAAQGITRLDAVFEVRAGRLAVCRLLRLLPCQLIFLLLAWRRERAQFVGRRGRWRLQAHRRDLGWCAQHIDRGRHLSRLGLAHAGRIEQESVFTYQATTVPAQFEQHVDEWFVDRLRGCDADQLPATALFDGEAKRRQGRGEFDIGNAVGVNRRQLDHQRADVVIRDGSQFDFGPQWLAQRRQDGQLAESGRMRGER